MDLSQIRELLSVVAESDVEELTVEEEGLKITVRKSAPAISMQPQGGGFGGGYPAMPYPPAPAYAPPAAPQPAPGGVPQGGPGQQGAPPAPPQQQSTGGASPAPDAPSEDAPAEAAGTSIPAPIVGTFYRCPSPNDPPFVEVGDTVKEGDVLCIIEAMKLMNEIESEVSGTIREILVDDAEPVEYEQPLFVIEEG